MKIEPKSGNPLLQNTTRAREEAKILETVLEASKDHVCVNLEYNDSWRLIEPHQLKTTKAGNTILTATKHETQEPRNYRLDRVQAAKLSKVAVGLAIPGPIGAAIATLPA